MQKRATTLAVTGALAEAYAGWQYGRRGRLRKLKGKIRPGQ
jgi:hypothetical protein